MELHELIKIKVEAYAKNKGKGEDYKYFTTIDKMLEDTKKLNEVIEFDKKTEEFFIDNFFKHIKLLKKIHAEHLYLLFKRNWREHEFKELMNTLNSVNINIIEAYKSLTIKQKKEFMDVYIYTPGSNYVNLVHTQKDSWIIEFNQLVIDDMNLLDINERVEYLRENITFFKHLTFTEDELVYVINELSNYPEFFIHNIDNCTEKVRLALISIVADSKYNCEEFNKKFESIKVDEIQKVFKLKPELVFEKRYNSHATDKDIDNALLKFPDRIIDLPASDITVKRVVMCLTLKPSIINEVAKKIDLYSNNVYIYLNAVLEGIYPKETKVKYSVEELSLAKEELDKYYAKLASIKTKYENMQTNDLKYSNIGLEVTKR